PYGIPYRPDTMQPGLSVWGGGWFVQNFGMRQYFLHKYFPDIFPDIYMLRALDFLLGRHPGSNTSSFVSGVGSRSLTAAYGFNRADFSYIPGGAGSGTALIRPDYPELLNWPFLWQQTEYMVGFAATDYILLVLGADHVLSKNP
ncbi:MAG: glycoside hydrolase, partial [Armatimonadota bacterium]